MGHTTRCRPAHRDGRPVRQHLTIRSFEAGLGAWSILGAPEGSPANTIDFERTVGLGGITAAVSTPDSVLFGFGLEQLDSTAARDAVVGAVLRYLAAT